ncbi:hypothetical protein HW555_007260 [Spodoptera exigua]|uniref:Uncharacterized protein n=1 Tax=Spodoptera exigua TaxID=7107 RepID=A0A835L3U3_SPOEX|nr:hypothetical protein HW555_007260 [Spodoptera exigua]
MRTISFIVLALTAVSFSQADVSHLVNDGRYHPELYGGYEGRYLAERNGKYGSIYNAYQPRYYQALSRELLTPVVSDSAEHVALPTSAVTYRTPFAPSTYRPFVYSTPRPFALSTQAPVYQKSVTEKSPVTYQKSVSQKAPVAVYHKSVSDAAATILREDRTYDENNYHYAYETNNGIAAEESGIVDASHNGVGGGTRVKGFYEYIGDDGLKYRVDYIADENGFRASGAHLPKAP